MSFWSLDLKTRVSRRRKTDLPFVIYHFSFVIGGFNFQVQLPERQGRGLEKPGASAERCEAGRPWNSTRRLESAESAPSIL